MNEQQANNTLDWVGALLSGEYKFGRGRLFNATTDCYCAVGVALEVFDMPLTADSAEKSKAWFTEHFGLKNSTTFYTSINDHSQNFLAVAVLLLDAVPNHSATIKKRKADLNAVLQKQMKEAKHADR